jgi:hypothetical protein
MARKEFSYCVTDIGLITLSYEELAKAMTWHNIPSFLSWLERINTRSFEQIFETYDMVRFDKNFGALAVNCSLIRGDLYFISSPNFRR